MHTFTRVEPRDLFNTAKCLKCFGHLMIQLSQLRPWELSLLTFSFDHDPKQDYRIEQDQNEGDLFLSGFSAWFKSKSIPVAFFTKYNSKDAYPMFANVGDSLARVFKETGDWHPEFLSAVIYADSVLH